MADVVLVDRSTVFSKPPYCIHGESLCVNCQRGVWLGTATKAAVENGALPLCLPCAQEVLPPEAKALPRQHLQDHLRKDGPHE